MQAYDRTGLLLSLGSSALGLGVAVAVFVLVIVWRARVRQYLRPALKLALLVFGILEKIGRPAEAEECLRNIDERPSRASRRVSDAASRGAALRSRWSISSRRSSRRGHRRSGRKRAEKARPEGATISSVPRKGAPAFNIGDVVVSVDRVRVRSLRQFRVQRRLSLAADTQIHFWRAGSVQVVKMAPTMASPRTRLGTRLHGARMGPKNGFRAERWRIEMGTYLVVATISLAAMASCTRTNMPVPGASPRLVGAQTETPAAKGGATPRWTHRTEEEWLVEETARDVAEMLLYAKDRDRLRAGAVELDPSAARDGGTAYPLSVALDANGPPLVCTLSVRNHVWSPATYEDLARTLLDRVQPKEKSSRRPTGPSILNALLDPRPEVLEQENQVISAGLKRDMLNPDTHEKAALLLGALCLREAAGAFSDTRRELCRITAHLTLARILRHRELPGPEGEYAEILLSTLVGRQREAMTQIDLLPKGQTTPAQIAWRNALALRNTADWRVVKEPARATLLERLEYFRALGRSQGGLKALDFLASRRAEPLPDWGRIALSSGSVSVEEGNTFVPALLELEMTELGTILRISRSRELNRENSVVELNVSPGRSVWPAGSAAAEPRVIDGGTWAAYAQRHILAALSSTERHLVDSLGAQEEGGEFRREMTNRFAGLNLFPLLGGVWESRVIAKLGGSPQPGYREAGRCPAVVAVTRSRPEVVTASKWGELATKCWQASRDGSLPGPSAWFQPAIPRGTAFDVRHRAYVGDLLKSFDLNIEALAQLAPYEPVLVSRLISARYADKPTPEQFASAWGPLADYDAAVVQRRLRMVTPDKEAFAELAKKACESDPDQCLGAGEKLRSRGFEEAAVVVYERAIALAHDRVGVSVNCRWLVQYYFEHGQTEKAMTLARMVGDVYSAVGLETLGQALERTEQYDDAQKVYQALVQRYPDLPDVLWSFYIRRTHRAVDGRFQAQAQEAIKRLFPQGMQQVVLGDLKERPSLANPGVPVMVAEELLAAGAHKDDTIMAVDGYRVRNPAQYKCVLSLADGPGISLQVFRDGQFQEVKGSLERWHFGPIPEARAAPKPAGAS
jgi:tetratricopeptide (TPR) repeat protein